MTNDMTASTSAVMWFSVGVWQRFATLTKQEQFEAVKAADQILERAPMGTGGSWEVPHFGPCSSCRATAIVSCFIVSQAKTEHVDSPFLEAARMARTFSEAAVRESGHGATEKPSPQSAARPSTAQGEVTSSPEALKRPAEEAGG